MILSFFYFFIVYDVVIFYKDEFDIKMKDGKISIWFIKLVIKFVVVFMYYVCVLGVILFNLNYIKVYFIDFFG